MSQAHDAADSIRRVAKFAEGLQLAAAVLERIGSLDNAIAEAEKSVVVAREKRDTDLTAINVEIDKAKVDAQKAKDKAGDILAAASTRAEKLIEQANADAEATRAQAERDCAGGLEAVATERQKLVIERKTAEAAKAKMAAKNAAMDKEAADKQAAIDALQAEHDTLVDAIASLKSKFA